MWHALGVTPPAKQMVAIVAGGIAGVMCFIGLVMLLHRRLTDSRIRVTSKPMDILVLVLLLAQLSLGLLSITVSWAHLDGTEMLKFMDWAQRIVTFRDGAAELIADVSTIFKCHLVLGLDGVSDFPVHAAGAYLERLRCRLLCLPSLSGSEAALSSVNGVAVADRPGAVRELLRQRAVAVGLLAPDTQDERLDDGIETLLDREVRTPEPTADECRRFYAQHPGDFTAGELAFARHILFAVTPGVPVGALRATAERTLAELCEYPERFADRARQLSNCPSGSQDGNLGQLARGECAPEFEAAIFGPAAGLLKQLVRTRFGFHIVAIDRRVEGQRIPFEAVREKIAAHLAAEVRRKALYQYVSVLAGTAELEDVDLATAGSPLVQ